jgi:hypothetical protein
MTTPDHDESKPRRRWPTYLAVVLSLLLAVYPFSIGPAFVLALYYPGVRSVYAVVYYPLAKTAGLFGEDALLESYVMWWVRAVEPWLLPAGAHFF